MTSRRPKARGAFFVAVAGIVGTLALSGCGGVPGDSVAIVEGNSITKAAFNHWIYVAAKGQAAQSPGSPVIVPDPPNFTKCVASLKTQVPSASKIPQKTLQSDCKAGFQQLRDQVLDFLIRSYWYQADAASQKIKVSNSDVQKAFQTAKQQQFPSDTQFQAFLKQTGQTQQDILYRVRVNQLYMKLLKKYSQTVTPAAIQSYYNSHRSQFGTVETRNIRLVLTKTQAQAQQAMSALQSGQSWKSVAKQFSTDAATKNKGGLLVGVMKGQQDQALDAAAFSAPAQKLLGPIKGQFGYYVFKVTGITKGSQQTLAQATTRVRQLLLQNQQSNAQNAVDNHAKKRFLSKTECRSGFVMVDCKGYKAPKTSTTTTPGTTTTTP